MEHNLLRMHRTGTNEDEFADIVDLAKLCHSSTKVRLVQRYLRHIAQHKGIGQRRYTAAFLEFEGSLQGGKVIAIDIVDNHTSLFAFHHLKTHGEGSQKTHSLSNLCRIECQINHQTETLHRIFERCVISHRNGETTFNTQHKVIHLGLCFGAFYIEYGNLCILMSTCPRHASSPHSSYFKGIADAWNIGIVDDNITIAEKVQFFDELLLLRLETCIVGCAYIGKNTDSRFDDGFEFLHLTRLADTCFEDGKITILVELPNAQRNTDLRIIASRRTNDIAERTQQLIKPFLDDGLSIGAGNADDRDVGKLTSMCCSEFLEGIEGVGHHKEPSFGTGVTKFLVTFGDDKGPHPLVVELRNITMSIALRGLDSKEECMVGKRQTAAVGQ